MKENKSNVFRGFLGFYIIIFIIFTLFNFLSTFSIFELTSEVAKMSKEGYIRPYIYNDIVVSILGVIFAIFSIYVLYLTFSKKRIAKLFNIIHMWLLFLIPIILDLIDWLIPPNYGLEGIGAILSIIFLLPWAIVWTIYFMKSDRVKNIFVK